MNILKLSIISAVAKNRVIGDKNTLIWKLPSDLKYFKNLTQSNVVVMGRKTYKSIGRLLPNRLNIILTKDKHYAVEGALIIHSFDELFSIESIKTYEQIFIIGGAEIYKLAMTYPQVQALYLTELHHEFDGDAYFPEYNTNEWEEISRESHQENNLNFDFVVYQRKVMS